ncbi:MAG: M20/M25/M40 family metallo-hydrolase, partial [Actinobacteria bacterium]|nr:M20/M25/M40 family metallo-hydrolase [Actinomycetota bacterium]
MSLIKYLEDLMKISSPSGNEEKMLLYLESVLKKSGFKVSFSEVPGKFPNLIALRKNPRFAISTHADHVIIGHKSEETYTILNDIVIGIGAADTKGQIASLLDAVSNSDLPAAIIITVDEEKEGSGSRSLENYELFDGILVLEPTDFIICTHQAGAIELKISTLCDSFHASCSKPESNPILMAARMLESLEDFRKKSKFIKKWGLPTLTPIYIESGKDDLYASPEEIKMQIDIPIAPEESPTQIFREVTEIITKHGFQIDWAESEPGFSFSTSSNILKKTEMAYVKTFKKKPKKGIMPSWTDAANFSLSGIDTIVFGAGKLEFCHTKREFVSINDLYRLSTFLLNFLKEITIKNYK